MWSALDELSSAVRNAPHTLLPKQMSTLSIDDIDDTDSYDDDEELRIAQEEWDESIAQLQLLVSVVAMPFFGKWLGRRCSHWGQSSTLALFPN